MGLKGHMGFIGYIGFIGCNRVHVPYGVDRAQGWGKLTVASRGLGLRVEGLGFGV